MYKTINVSIGDNLNRELTLHQPNKCPICNKGIEPKVLSAYSDDSSITYVSYFCTLCKKVFIGEYWWERSNELVDVYPKSDFSKREFSCEINNLSESFVHIYNEAKQAEELRLDLAGMGYRKALEFLLYDYLTKYNLATIEQLQKQTLSQNINQFIDNDTLRSLSIACAWLGNDHTHYFQKHDDYTLDDLKRYIDSAVSILEGQIRANELTNTILKKKNEQ